MNKKGQQPRRFVWVREQNEAKQAEQVNVVSIADEENAQNFEFPYQEAFKHHQIAITSHEMCGEVQVDSPKSLNGDLTLKQEPSQDFVEAIQPAPPEMEEGGQATIDHFREINLGTTYEPKPIFVSAMLNDEGGA